MPKHAKTEKFIIERLDAVSREICRVFSEAGDTNTVDMNVVLKLMSKPNLRNRMEVAAVFAMVGERLAPETTKELLAFLYEQARLRTLTYE